MYNQPNYDYAQGHPYNQYYGQTTPYGTDHNKAHHNGNKDTYIVDNRYDNYGQGGYNYGKSRQGDGCMEQCLAVTGAVLCCCCLGNCLF